MTDAAHHRTREAWFDEFHGRFLLNRTNVAIFLLVYASGSVRHMLRTGDARYAVTVTLLAAVLGVGVLWRNRGQHLRISNTAGILYIGAIHFENWLERGEGALTLARELNNYSLSLIAGLLCSLFFVGTTLRSSLLRTSAAQLALHVPMMAMFSLPVTLNTVLPFVYVSASAGVLSWPIHQLYQTNYASIGLLTNIVPHDFAEEHLSTGTVAPKAISSATIVFVDIEGFTNTSAATTAEFIVAYLDDYIARVDTIVERHGLEKIKTIGDAYLFAGLGRRPANVEANAAVDAALEVLALPQHMKPFGTQPLRLRAGVHHGAVIAGAVGTTRTHFDIWGDAVNHAAHLEKRSSAGRARVSDTVQSLVAGRFTFERSEPAADGTPASALVVAPRTRVP